MDEDDTTAAAASVIAGSILSVKIAPPATNGDTATSSSNGIKKPSLEQYSPTSRR